MTRSIVHDNSKNSLKCMLHRSYRTGTGYNRTFTEAIRPLISPVILFISSTWWAVSSQNSIIQLQPRLFFSAIGTTFSNMTVCNTKSKLNQFPSHFSLKFSVPFSCRSNDCNKIRWFEYSRIFICIDSNAGCIC